MVKRPKGLRTVHVKWAEFDEACEVLRNKLEPLKKSGRIETIYGVPRGGLVLAVKLSHLLNLQLITDQTSIDSRTLIVDEICDTGKTLIGIASEANFTATLYYRKNTLMMPDFTYQEEQEGTWVVFPWEP